MKLACSLVFICKQCIYGIDRIHECTQESGHDRTKVTICNNRSSPVNMLAQRDLVESIERNSHVKFCSVIIIEIDFF